MVGDAACMKQGVTVAQETIKHTGKFLGITYAESATGGDKPLGFTELSVLGPKHHRNAVDGSFIHVVDAGTKPTAYVSQLPITVYRRQYAEAIDNERIKMLRIGF